LTGIIVPYLLNPAGIHAAGLNPPATPPGCDGSGDHRGLSDRRAAPGGYGSGHYRGLSYGRADDAYPSDTCWPQWHCHSPAFAVASSASIEAMIACRGIRPSAISWPPERRAAEAKGAAHRFSQMSTPAVLPGSIAAAR
jgi:hypothetical protein